MLIKNKEYPLIEVINEVIKVVKTYEDSYDDYNNFYLYSRDHSESSLLLNNSYFYADCPTITDDGDEIYPDIVIDDDLIAVYTGESFIDVISLAYEQKNNASYDEYLQALNYYYDNDTFLDLK